MKKILPILAILMVTIYPQMMGAVTASAPTVGDGTSSNPYEIATAGNLMWFANQVNGGSTSICGRLTADINYDCETTIGYDHGHQFSGTFDGNGYTVTVNFTTTTEYTALFHFVKDATIKNLKTVGTISTSRQYAAGIVARSDGTTNITNCGSSVAITSTVNGDGTHGGLVANNVAIINLTNCYFNGSLVGENTTNCGGLVGWTATGATITNCLFNPSSATLSTSGACTMTRYKSGVSPTITNSYYSSAFGTEQGTAVTSSQLSSGEVCYNLNNGVMDGTQSWYQNLSGTADATPVLDSSHSTVYGGGQACPSTLTYGNNTHTLADYNTDGYQICGNEGCSHVSDNPEPATLTEDSYQIANKGNLVWFARKVNAGETSINGTLTTDIDLGTDQTMIGDDYYHQFSGTFDGGHHTVTIAYQSSSQNTSLFCYVSGATIKNLLTAGTITTSASHAAGVVASCYGVTMKEVTSSVTINSSFEGEGTDGGLISEIYSSSTLTSCAFIGRLLGTKSSLTGGLVGLINSVTVTMTDCYAYVAEQTTSAQNRATLAMVIPVTEYTGTVLTLNNCYYVPTVSSYTYTQGTELSVEDAQSGAFCYKLNGYSSTGTLVWHQTLGTDNSPVCDPTHGTVYSGDEACPLSATTTYTNTTHSFPSGTGVLNCTGNGCTATIETATWDASTGYYTIASKAQFKWFIGEVNRGGTTMNGKLTTDIDFSSDTKMIGNATYAYAGSFDGGDHTITLGYDVDTKGAALFLNVAGATIQNLTVTGTINTAGTAVGGLVCYSTGVTLKNCVSSVAITASDESCRAGGLVEEIQSTSTSSLIQDCLFDGSFSGTFTTASTASCGGMIGYIDADAAQVDFKRCLCVFNNQSSTLNSYTFAGGSGSNYTLSQCYYQTALKTAQGTQASSSALSSGEICYKLNYTYYDGTQYWYETLGTDSHPFPISSHGIVYGGYDACPASNSYSNKTHTGTKTGTDGYYQVTCTNTGCSSTHTCDIPTYSSTIGGYSIANKGNLVWFSHYVNSINNAVNGTLTSDIDMGTASSGEGDAVGSFTPIGSSSSHQFQGTFDGGYHRIKNMKITGSSEYGTGFFGHVKGNTTIENLVIDSTCTVSIPDYDFVCGGIVGLVGTTSNITIKNCGNEATIDAWNNVGGIIAGVSDDDSEILIQNCYNAGAISGRSTMGAICGSLINFTLTNCYNTGKLTNKSGSTESTGLLYCGRNATVTNCYNINDSQGTGVTKIDAADVYTGRLCQLLNSTGDDLSIWAQELETETAPVLSTATAGRSAGVTFTRSMDNAWGTIVLPFDLTITDDDPYTLYNYNGISNSKVYLSKKTGTLAAGTPAVICMKESSKTGGKYVLSPTVGTISSTTITNPYPLCKFTLTGVYSMTSITTGYKLVNGKFTLASSLRSSLEDKVYCEPFSAYLDGFSLSVNNQYPLSILPGAVNITKAAELVSFAGFVNDGIDYTNIPVSLSNDIDMENVSYTPIGTSTYPFHGSFNGNGHRIKNLTVSNTTGYTGLFGYVGGYSKATMTNISNLIVDSTCTITSTGTGVAGLVGCVTSTSGYDCAVSIESCGNEAAVTGTKNVSGLVGGVYDNDNTILNIISSYNTGAITADSESATICGWANKDFKIEGCYNMGTISNGSSFYRASNDNYGTINNCFDINGSYGSLIEKVTTTQIRNGYVCYELNGNDSIAFVQDLENDSYPLPVTCVESSKKMLGLHYTRTMTNQWGSLCLPFDITIDEDAPCDYYELEGVTDNTLSLKKVSYEVSCGYPVLIRMSAASKNAETGKYELSILQKDRSYSADPKTDDAVDGLTLTGTYTTIDITDQEGYILANNKFWNIKDLAYESDGTTHKTDENGNNITVSCNAFRAYIAGSINTDLVGFGSGDDSHTAVEALNAITSDTAEYYDMGGRRLNDLQKGVNIVRFSNGVTKKIIIK